MWSFNLNKCKGQITGFVAGPVIENLLTGTNSYSFNPWIHTFKENFHVIWQRKKKFKKKEKILKIGAAVDFIK